MTVNKGAKRRFSRLWYADTWQHADGATVTKGPESNDMCLFATKVPEQAFSLEGWFAHLDAGGCKGAGFRRTVPASLKRDRTNDLLGSAP